MKRRWRLVLLVVVAALAVPATMRAVTVHRKTTGRLDHGTVFTQTSGQITVKPGELFSVEVPAYRLAGDVWSMAAPAPDPAVAKAAGDEYVHNFDVRDLFDFGDIGNTGSGGRYYFTFRAQNPGRTTMTVHIAYRDELGGDWLGGPDQIKRQFTVDVSSDAPR
ncbi:protease inhibitor I42 family protein [Kitasatospora sp. MY 5-36]|uniref:protease inhibitor I42 family protein n=1 Tax=Kitasatospora sp. MY 5-36 TaxID=1678027 RepID=UPI000670A097|nr:protease inhibitor I42 family protein [Kitasatospora sp. MY 5-36]